MPLIIEKSISIISDAGHGMAMFKLGKCPNCLQFFKLPILTTFFQCDIWNACRPADHIALLHSPQTVAGIFRP